MATTTTCGNSNDCYNKDGTSACGAGNNISCVCSNGYCTSTNCSTDKDCPDGTKCANTGPVYGGTCTAKACTDTTDCESYEQCNGSICLAKKCSDDGGCGKGAYCSDGYCVVDVNPYSGVTWIIAIILFIIVAAIIVYFAYRYYKNNKVPK